MTMPDFMIDAVLNAYRNGLFPMAEEGDAAEFEWYSAPNRGQLSLNALHVPERLRRMVLRAPFEIRIDTAFAAIVEGCAEKNTARPRTWINRGIRDLFVALHRVGHAHSVECWRDGALVGGVYGLAFGGGAFAGESMFSRAPNASKIALIHLCARLWKGGFTLLDTQLVNDHLRQFGVYEVSEDEYMEQLEKALRQPADFKLKKFPDLSEKNLVEEYLAFLQKKG